MVIRKFTRIYLKIYFIHLCNMRTLREKQKVEKKVIRNFHLFKNFEVMEGKKT